MRLILLLPILGCALLPTATLCGGEKSDAEDMARITAFLAKHCTHCHGPERQRADLALHIYKNVPSILKDRKKWQVVQQLVRSGEMPPRTRKQPELKEVETFTKAVADLFARVDAGTRDPGRVTMRRLNRAEYNNTIRDLVGVDFQPAEDFPSDDVGHGFDNIGDVLTLSPVLMERYLAASEAIVQRAIVVKPVAPPKRHLSAQYTEPAGPKVPLAGRYRFLTSKPGSPIETGPVHTSYKVPADGEYIFRTRVYAETTGKEPVRLAVLATGTSLSKPSSEEEVQRLSGAAVAGLKPLAVLETIEVTARSDKKPQAIEVKVPADLDFQRIAVALVKPAAGQDVKLFVEHLALEGPLDTRPATQRMLLAHPAGQDPKAATHDILQRFASRAYRRPATKEEIDRLVKLVEQVQARGDPWEAGMQLAIQAVLVSPKFLFRVETDERAAGKEPLPLNDYHLASRLSYFLWSSMPDQELFDLASRKELHKNLEAQVRRMLQDPRSKALVENFASQWLQTRLLTGTAPDPKLFPEFDERLRSAMKKETELFFEAVLREDRSILELIDADFTFLNERLARHYGIADTNGNRYGKKMGPRGQPIRGEKFVRVKLADGERGGLLTQASILTITSNPTRTSPVKRGRWILEQILGTPPPPPPPNVPELAEGEKAQTTGTLRQRMEQHRSNPSCASCHARMDPIGFAFENFDAVGKFRLKDGNFPIDPSGSLPDGRSFKGPADLKAILKEKSDLFARCLAEKMLTYAIGRGLEYYDKRAVDGIVAALARDRFRFSTLLTEIVRSDPFRYRRGKDQP